MWVLIVYMLIITILAPACGRLADLYGRKNLSVAGLAVFTIGSLFCDFAADNPADPVPGPPGNRRGPSLVANGTIIVVDAFPKWELGKAMGILSTITAAAFVAGPILGGFLMMIDWRWNFFINVPLGVIATIYAYYRLREPGFFPEVNRST
jgi:MFS family permease